MYEPILILVFIRASLNKFRQSQEENCVLRLATVSHTVSWVTHKNRKLFIFLLETETKRKQLENSGSQ